MRRTRPNDGLTLLQNSSQEQQGIITQTQVLELPAPLQRYLNYAQVEGKEPIRTVRLKQQGFMRTQPAQKWMPLTAEQYFTIKPHAFLWQCTMRPLPLAWVAATDKFIEGHGNLRIKLLSLITLGNAYGPEMDQSELQRYLAEVIWFPTAWLSNDIEWQGIDDHAVKATLRESGVTAPMVLQIDEQGQVTQVTTERYKEEQGHYRLMRWSGRCEEYREVEGMRIPTKIAITWHLPTGDFTWFHCNLTEIEYNQSGKVTTF